jgi:hypothetical protein
LDPFFFGAAFFFAGLAADFFEVVFFVALALAGLAFAVFALGAGFAAFVRF